MCIVVIHVFKINLKLKLEFSKMSLEWLTPEILLEEYKITSQIINLFSVLLGIASFFGAYYLLYLYWIAN